jgi:endogenous inhibitor of DNA gyrase (YacG/DUF329 family)
MSFKDLHKSGEKASNWQGGQVEKVCQYCGITYKIDKSRINKSHYCSRRCADLSRPKGSNSKIWQGGNIGMVCPCCHRSFSVKRGDKRRKCCSRYCSDEIRRNRIHLDCAICGNKYVEQLSKANRYEHSFCSTKCRFEYMAASGANTPGWRGGISFAPYPPIFNDVFKRMIRKRDNFTCAICGDHGNHVHHINYIKGDTTPENCITLCTSCHMRTNANREYWQFSLSTILLQIRLKT